MVDYITIDQARVKLMTENVKNSSIIVKCIGVGEVNSGNGAKGPYKKQIATLQDHSGMQQLTLWGEDIGKLDQGNHYKLETPFWTVYKEEPQLSLGNYCKVQLAGETDLLPKEASTTTTETKLEPIPSVEVKDSHIPTEQKIMHDEVWAFAMVEATKVYPLGTANSDPDKTSRLILAQVFYKKNMDYIIHGGKD